MIDENENIHPDLVRARSEANKIVEGKFDDLGAKAADEVVEQIIAGLQSEDKTRRAQAREKIQENELKWAQYSGTKKAAGTSGAILTRLLALGIINELPQGEIIVLDIPPHGDILLANLRADIEKNAYQLMEMESKKFLKNPHNHAFAATHAGSWSGYATVEANHLPADQTSQDKLQAYACIKVGILPNLQGKGIESSLLEKTEEWCKAQKIVGLWTEYNVHDKLSADMYQKKGFSAVDMYRTQKGSVMAIAAKKLT